MSTLEDLEEKLIGSIQLPEDDVNPNAYVTISRGRGKPLGSRKQLPDNKRIQAEKLIQEGNLSMNKIALELRTTVYILNRIKKDLQNAGQH